MNVWFLENMYHKIIYDMPFFFKINLKTLGELENIKNSGYSWGRNPKNNLRT